MLMQVTTKTEKQSLVGFEERQESATDSKRAWDKMFALATRATKHENTTSVQEGDIAFSLQDVSRHFKDMAQQEASNDLASTPDKATLKAIEDMVRQMEQGMDKEHASSQSVVDNAETLVQDCATAAHATLKDIAGLKRTMESGRVEHSACRTAEVGDRRDKEKACKAWDDYRMNPANNQAPLCISNKLTRPAISTKESVLKSEMESCIRSTDHWVSSLHEQLKSCDLLTTTHTNKTEDCKAKQRTFESSFCTYAAKLDDACDAQDVCRNSTIAGMKRVLVSEKNAEMVRKSEFEAGQKILCFINVFKVNASLKKQTLERCKSVEANDSKYNITYHSIPVAAVCNKESVVPCNSGWLQREYRSQSWHSQANMGACQACPSPKPAPTPSPPPQIGCKLKCHAGKHFEDYGGNCDTEKSLTGWNFIRKGDYQVLEDTCQKTSFKTLQWYYSWCGGRRGSRMFVDGSDHNGGWKQIAVGTIDAKTCGVHNMTNVQLDPSYHGKRYNWWRLRHNHNTHNHGAAHWLDKDNFMTNVRIDSAAVDPMGPFQHP
eukprot:CAMPEP_0172808608 /NCGR_PEP_ID=MMETSP1075-20121228/7793_1 /TAXON_ID=2916 /ORGANISM="Ceratium fusus, Strain PA161109" /LENGTH=546 /DNA_ID=CAMNT_0013647785 /DNA_START=172 /DNA_END=1808 /DNA_ORIENTATION=+